MRTLPWSLRSHRGLVAAGVAACMLALVACGYHESAPPGPPPSPPQAPSPTTTEESVVTTGTAGLAQDQATGRMYAPAPFAMRAPENTETYPDAKPNPVHVAATDPVSTFSIDVDTASYANVRRFLNEGSLPPTDAVRVEEMVNYFDYSYALPADRSQPFQPTIAVYPTPWNKNTLLLHIGIKGFDIPRAERPHANLVFLIDTSGSMDEPNKLPLLKRSFRLLVDQLGPDDKVSIVVYAGSAGTVLPPTSGADKAAILAALDNLSAGGSTAGGEGIRQAYQLAEANFDKNAVNRVILATDGDFNVGITDPNALEDFVARKRETGVFLTVLGFGKGNYNDATMQKLAQAGNGNAAYIDTLNEARKVFVDELSGTLFTIAKDVKIQVEFNPARVAEYRLIGYETRLLDRTDFNNDKVDAGEIGSGHTVTALYEITPVGSPGQMADPLRYPQGQPQQPVMEKPTLGEYAFVKIRYKLPSEDTSHLITRPVTEADLQTDFGKLPTDLRFAAAVAGAGQLLRHDPYSNSKRPNRRRGGRRQTAIIRIDVEEAKTAAAMQPLEQPGGGGSPP